MGLHFIYVIKSERNGRLYKGMSEDPVSRLVAHNSGKVRSTKGYRPWRIVYQEAHPGLVDALKREKFLKTGDGRAFLKSLDL